MAIDDQKEACKTYLEQTKLLITLASTFIVAPAVFYKDLFSLQITGLLGMELSFIFSVMAGYVAVATITGTQFIGEYNINRKSTRWSSLTQLALFILGLGVFIFSLIAQHSIGQKERENEAKDSIKKNTIINNYR